MATIDINSFSGLAPMLDPRKLPDHMAQVANNCDFSRQRLEPFRGNTVVQPEVGSHTLIYKNCAGAFEFSSNFTKVIKAPIVNDGYGTQIAIDGDYPKIRRDGTDWFRLGVPAPVTAPHTTLIHHGADPEEANPAYYKYIYTYVNDFGQEGPNSPPSALQAIDFSQTDHPTLTVHIPDPAPTGNYNFSNGTVRIYRSGADGVFTFLVELNGVIAAAEYQDSITDDQLGFDSLQTSTWYGPPDDNTSIYPKGTLTCLEVMPNKFLAGGSGNELVFSEEGVVHAFPVNYRKILDDDIVGLALAGPDLVVATKGRPYIVMGSTAESMSEYKLPSEQACVSAESVTSVGDYAMYASPDGLVGVQRNEVHVLTKGLLDKQAWQAMNPETIKGVAHEGEYYGLYKDDGGQDRMFIFDPSAKKNGLRFIESGGSSAFIDYASDTLYINQGDDLVTFNTDVYSAPYVWHSKEYSFPELINLACIKIWAEAYPITMTVIAHTLQGDVEHQFEYETPWLVHASDFYWLESGIVAQRWSIKASSLNPLYRIMVATSPQELSHE